MSVIEESLSAMACSRVVACSLALLISRRKDLGCFATLSCQMCVCKYDKFSSLLLATRLAERYNQLPSPYRHRDETTSRIGRVDCHSNVIENVAERSSFGKLKAFISVK